ncbi:MAG: leucine-rich repeat protein, partial [Lachnospiraceae bacterium]|nr:leucine-rich repeat protein [Lachnospiraceae bacterium]
LVRNNHYYIRLTKDLTASDSDSYIEIPDGSKLDLDLNGHVLDRGNPEAGEEGVAFYNKGKFILSDSNPDASHNPQFTYDDPTTDEVEENVVDGGIITGGNGGPYGGCISNESTLIINSGTFYKNNAYMGGAIYNTGDLNINYAGFYGNTAEYGGALYSTIDFTVNDGCFYGNKAGLGGAIYNKGAIFTQENATINNNFAKKGGGVCNSADATYNLNGGTITGNVAKLGGGVYNVSKYNSTTNTGNHTEINITNQNKINITGNKSDTADNNFYLETGEIINFTKGESDCKIGICSATKKTHNITCNIDNAEDAAIISKYFSSDDERFAVKVSNNNLTLAIRDNWSTTDDGFNYFVSNDGKSITIKGYEGKETNITIPNEIDGIPVTTIGARAFENNSDLEKVKFGSNITTIGDEAFNYCENLTDLELPENLVTIGESAFFMCGKIETLNIPQYVTTIGKKAFCGCTNITSIEVDFKNKSLDSRNECNAIIDTENDILIQGCNNTVIPEGIKEIGPYAFFSCTFNEINIPDGVESIGDYAFYRCSYIKEVVFPEGLISIGKEAFSSASNLEKVVFPKSIEYIGGNAFLRTAWYGKIYTNEELIIVNNILMEGKMVKGDVVIPYGVTKISDNAFESNQDITSIKFQSREEAMAVSSGAVESIEEPVEISIGNKTFYNCKNLKSIEMPENVIAIGDSAFENCSGLKSIIIPKNVSKIGCGIFAGCNGLEEIKVDSDNKYFNSGDNANALIETATKTLISGCKNTKVPNDIKIIGKNAFYAISDLVEISIPKSVESIGTNAFYETIWLDNKRSENPLVIVNDFLIDGMKTSGDVVIPDGVTTIMQGAFVSNFDIESVEIPSSVTTIGEGAFFNCTELETVLIPKSVTSIEDDAFGKSDVVIFVTTEGSYAETYAKENGIFYVTYPDPDAPKETEEPEESGEPEVTSGPAVIESEEPVADESASPEASDAPDFSIAPSESNVPDESNAPDNSANPAESGEPGTEISANPVESGEPGAETSANPSESGNPAESGEPGTETSANPSESGNPAESGEPGTDESANPEESNKPGADESANPAESKEPGADESANPSESANPVEPGAETSANPSGNSNPSASTAPGANVNPGNASNAASTSAVENPTATSATNAEKPDKVVIKSIKKKGKKVTVKWKKVTGADGYQLQYAKNKSFKGKKAGVISKTTGKVKLTINLKKFEGKKCFVRVRAYKTVDGKKVWGVWSKKKILKN